mgnify:CR=1 FL=1
MKCEECGKDIVIGEEYLIYDNKIYCDKDCRDESVDSDTFYHVLGDDD